MTAVSLTVACPVCDGRDYEPRFRPTGAGTELGVDAQSFRPSADRFGEASGLVVRCRNCGHQFVEQPPPPDGVRDAYADAIDEVSLREEAGQVETARRALTRIETSVASGLVCDLGCWTGSFLVAARERGWRTAGVEPSHWAASRAGDRGLGVRQGELHDHGLDAGSCRLVVMTDVLEHLTDPGDAVDEARALLEPDGLLWITVPDAGSLLARALGRRWWSVLPMHLQYFTGASMERLLTRHGFRVVWAGTHAKVFTARYYAERLGGYHPALERLAVGAVTKTGLAARLVAPDFHDRLAVLARRAAPVGPAGGSNVH
ncbi:MAG: class I SAM-dependent methyltransferase [Actinobacteria bacterium]|nr:class I SAM-dependent methyltransferase [Actinomycetota bacterium]MBV9935907.1 class I SAM-dependent methyltransferase [Actinomycetota bacterium]